MKYYTSTKKIPIYTITHNGEIINIMKELGISYLAVYKKRKYAENDLEYIKENKKDLLISWESYYNSANTEKWKKFCKENIQRIKNEINKIENEYKIEEKYILDL